MKCYEQLGLGPPRFDDSWWEIHPWVAAGLALLLLIFAGAIFDQLVRAV